VLFFLCFAAIFNCSCLLLLFFLLGYAVAAKETLLFAGATRRPAGDAHVVAAVDDLVLES
jgi:hypothetical protein